MYQSKAFSTISEVSWTPYSKHPVLPHSAGVGRHWGHNCKLLCLVLFPVGEIHNVWTRSTELFVVFVFLSTYGKQRITCLLQERLFKQTFPFTFNSANIHHHQSSVFSREETIATANIWKLRSLWSIKTWFKKSKMKREPFPKLLITHRGKQKLEASIAETIFTSQLPF